MKKILYIVIFLITFYVLTSPIKAENFTWPSDGYVVWKYYTDTEGQEGISGTYHTGIDIWSNTDGLWNNGVTRSSNPVYSAYLGQVVYVDSLGVIVKHTDSLYTKYWHMKDRQVALWGNVNTNTVMGYQDYANAVHIHVTVASSSAGYDTDNTLDPSPYFGVQLYEGQPNAVPVLYQVTRSLNCGGANITISNQTIQGPKDCGASNSITINPDTTIDSTGGTVTLHVP